MTTDNHFKQDLLEDRGIIIPPHEGEKLNIGQSSVIFKVTSELSNDQLGVYEIELQAQAIGAQLHYHRFIDETFIVTQGELTVEIGNQQHLVKAGGVAYCPRLTPHGFRNDTDQNVKLMLLFNPSKQREGFFKGLCEILSENPIDPQKYLTLYQKYDSYPVDAMHMLPVREVE